MFAPNLGRIVKTSDNGHARLELELRFDTSDGPIMQNRLKPVRRYQWPDEEVEVVQSMTKTVAVAGKSSRGCWQHMRWTGPGKVGIGLQKSTCMQHVCRGAVAGFWAPFLRSDVSR